MTARPWVWALGALLVAGTAVTAGADNGRRKGSGGSGGGGTSRGGGGSESVGARHHGGSGAARSSSSESSASEATQRERGSGGRGSGGRPTTGAEARHPTPGTGHGYGGAYYGYRYPYYRYGYGYPYYGYGYGSPYWGWYGVPYYGYDPFFYGGWGYGGGYVGASYSAGAPYRYREMGSVRTLVDPEKTKILVDGYYAGTVDDFDGMFQRLYLPPGRHDLTFKLDGYRTHKVRIYVTEDRTTKIRHEMQKGAGEETVEDLTGGIEEPPYRMTDAGPDRDREPRPYDDRDRGAPSRDEGALRLDIRPDDATVYINGEFYGAARRAGIIPLPVGRHHVEVVRPGRRTVEREVEIQAGRTETLAIDLERN